LGCNYTWILDLLFSTFLGGSSIDLGLGIALDNSSNIYVTGRAQSSNFPTVNPIQGAFGGGAFGDGFVTKYSSIVMLLDHFLSYDVKRSRNSEKFSKRTAILQDQFGEGIFKIKKAKALMNPVNKNNEGISNMETHLISYEIKGKKFEFLKQNPNLELLVSNQFGEIKLNVKSAERLLVPALKSLTEPELDEVDQFNVDHFLCYKAKIAKGTGKFPKDIVVQLVDQFDQPKSFKVLKPSRICNPVTKIIMVDNQEVITEIQNPDDHLLCYKIKREPEEPKHVSVKDITVRDQFGQLHFDTKKEEELCVPSTKEVFPEPTPPPDGDDDDDDDDDDDE